MGRRGLLCGFVYEMVPVGLLRRAAGDGEDGGEAWAID